MIKKIGAGWLVLFFLLVFFVNTAGGEDYFEIQRMQNEFSRIIGNGIAVESVYLQENIMNMKQIFINIGSSIESQYFVYVDRNSLKQMIFVCFFDAQTEEITLIGADKVSTGNEKRAGFFITPCGIFKNTIEFLGYRALGTKNNEGWRGLGTKDSRVWDFGWQKTYKKNQERTIRLLMHATDPVFGEKRLGKVDSKGCIRISGRMNKFLDHFGLLDKEYEENKDKKTVAWLLKADRQPVAYAGKYLLIGNSGNYGN
ncbi:MAG: hypothetical protein A2174_03230 [Candidatus Portnoybacteria bacterium RBG_13_41_18]|uniref:YkuD domain-containing protein n=1 Tax=Candidatus Portnoybacteria bacterium RBG_13_41_18 TaxID=1801991 RepID=A0A1G2F6D9_9BACT|nr:MAG: hypothetical protein A2174_03230 [Candidatus Portnoybacteria bacterium RBG_13_41_18]